MAFFDFYLIFINIFFTKIAKKGNFLPTGADVASGSSGELTRGAEATWQSRGWPTRGAGGAQGATTWQGATHPRESTWAPVWGATWQ